MAHLLVDFPPSPLDTYRKKSSFDWKKLKIFMQTEEIIKFEYDLHESLKARPGLQHSLKSGNLDEQRHAATKASLFFAKTLDPSPGENVSLYRKKRQVVLRTMIGFNPSAATKLGAARELMMNGLKSQGTERHQQILRDVENGKISGTFCLTEVGHGSNSNGMRTMATYDAKTREFVLHTPDFEATKCFAGGLGKSATHAIVYAQLYVAGTHYGLHAFVVPIRDPSTMVPHRGLIVGDLGEKIGLNGNDNGFLLFDNYRVPRENLLNKSGDVTSDGRYVTSIQTLRERKGATLLALSIGRIDIITASEMFGTKALTIAIRYAAVRKQFGPEEPDEVPILEYQTHQHRLLPYLAAVFVVRFFAGYLDETMYQFAVASAADHKESAAVGMEIHAISSGAKPLASWLFRDAIQECRDACGGHGYLRAAGFGDLRNDHDANCTYEGENHILIQQTSNWLLKFGRAIRNNQKVSTPLKSVDFLSDASSILTHRFLVTSVEEVCRLDSIMDAYQWLVCYLLKETRNKFEGLVEKEGKFWAKSNAQIFYAKSLAIAFIQHLFLHRMLKVVNEAADISIRRVLSKLLSLYGLWSLEKFLPTLYEGGYADGPQPSRLVHEAILKLCSDVKDDAVSLVDAIAPPDFILNSFLGASDGQVYQHLQLNFLQMRGCMGRPAWWKEIIDSNFHSKL